MAPERAFFSQLSCWLSGQMAYNHYHWPLAKHAIPQSQIWLTCLLYFKRQHLLAIQIAFKLIARLNRAHACWGACVNQITLA